MTRSTLKLTQRERIVSRGFCTGPVDGAPAPGEVGQDGRAECLTCKRRVAVTRRGMYAHHKNFLETARFIRGSFR